MGCSLREVFGLHCRRRKSFARSTDQGSSFSNMNAIGVLCQACPEAKDVWVNLLGQYLMPKRSTVCRRRGNVLQQLKHLFTTRPTFGVLQVASIPLDAQSVLHWLRARSQRSQHCPKHIDGRLCKSERIYPIARTWLRGGAIRGGAIRDRYPEVYEGKRQITAAEIVELGTCLYDPSTCTKKRGLELVYPRNCVYGTFCMMPGPARIRLQKETDEFLLRLQREQEERRLLVQRFQEAEQLQRSERARRKSERFRRMFATQRIGLSWLS